MESAGDHMIFSQKKGGGGVHKILDSIERRGHLCLVVNIFYTCSDFI